MDSQKITIGGKEYNYKLKISKRASYMRLQVSAEAGLEFIVPYGVSIKEAERFLEKKKDWVLKHLVKYANNSNTYMFFGENLDVEHQHDLFLKKHKVELKENVLRIYSPSESKVPVNSLFNAWLKLKAYNYIPDRVKFLAQRTGFCVNKVSIRDQKTRWGSCSRARNLSFNYKLMAYREEVIDYVIVHELCHLKELNHSKKFWSLVEKFIPDYKTLRKELKKFV